MAKKQVVVNEAGEPTGVIQFTFEDGRSLSIDANALAEKIKFRALVHGLSQKVGDSYAGAKAEADPVAFSYEAAKGTIEQILAGDWKAAREGGPRVTDLAKACAIVTGQTLEEAVAFVGQLDEDATKALRKKPKIAAALAKMAADKAIEKANKAAEAAANSAE